MELAPIIFGLLICLVISVILFITLLVIALFFKEKAQLQIKLLKLIILFLFTAAWIVTLGDKSTLI
ncbi:hypothetical protein BN2127_JRS1_02817 [Bacillus cereus]|nr:hypothetical protein BN2127_JRS1_02817 [Bacillus cereus]